MYDNFHNENHDPIYNTGHENYYIGSWFDQFEPFELVWQKFVKKSIVKATCADDIDGLGSISTIWHGPNFNLDRNHVCFFLLIVKVPFFDHDIDGQGSNLASYSELVSSFLLIDC